MGDACIKRADSSTAPMPPLRRFIAIVEDDASVRKALERQVRSAGYRCQGFASAEDFLAVASSCDAACIVSDIGLGGMTGLQLALHPEVIRLNFPVVFITGSADPLICVAARELGAALLHKPIIGQELLDAIVDTAGPPIADGDK
jgi:FixJ family two-component response regulator